METDFIDPTGRVVIIGSGNVGASCAYSILNQEIAHEILMIDINLELNYAQVLDLHDAGNFTSGVEVIEGDYSKIRTGDIVVLTAGFAQKEDQSRTDLLNLNAQIISDILAKIKETGKIVYLLVVTNPVDVLTYIAIKESGIPENMVFGSGTFLDTARLRVYLGQKLGVNPKNVHAYILGEHGDSSFPVLSSANIGGIALRNFQNYEEITEGIVEKIRDQAYTIIKGKKATYYGIGSAVAKICKSILRDENSLITLSVMLKGEYGESEVVLGVPAKVGMHGAKIIGEIQMDENEKTMFKNSAEVVKNNISLL